MKEMPVSVVVEMMRKLRVLEADFYRYAENQEQTTNTPYTKGDAPNAWRVAASEVQMELDRIEHNLNDLGVEFPQDYNELTVGAEVQRLFQD